MTTSTAPGLSASLSAEADLLRLQKSDQQQTSGTFGGESDPASSLRQAALKTLRSKRRKPVTGSDISSALPVRPTTVADSVQLDYGQEEPTPALPPPPAPEPVSAAVSVPANKAEAAASSLDNDATMREEGEISENEDPPPPKPAPKPTPPAKIPAKIFPKPASPPASRSVASASASVAKPPIPPPAKVEPLAPPPPVTPTSSKLSSQRSSLGDPMVPLTPLTGSTDNFRLEHSSYIIDAAHVRPGLTLSQEQYNTAKDIVLDLLGWGVPPEYLVDCGLSREIVYYVFTELNLRLPSNLDTTGLPPFPPTDKLAALLGAADLSFQKTPVQPAPENNLAPRNSISHPSLPPRPIAPQGVAKAPRPSSTALNSLSASAPAFVPRTAPSSPDTHVPSTVAMSPEDSLAAMEQQKRQELLARKAVQASRRRKDSSMATSSSGDGSSPEKPVAVSSETRPKPVVPQASVDDFLKTIDPTNGSIARARRASSPEPMQVDEDIPGLGGSFSEYRPVPRPSMHAPPPPLPPPDRLPSPSMLDSVDFSSDGNSPEERRMVERALGLDETPPKESASSSSSAPISAVPSARSSTTPQPTAPIPRRGMKRPVAADFVDIDSGPATNPYAIVAPSRTGSIGNGYTHGGPTSHPNPHVRRKMNAAAAGGFASVSNMRRCVIDLSDSEDGGDDDEEEMPPTPAPEPTEAAKLELEIERMRRKIREREEQQRQKMMAASSGRATPTLPSTPVLAAAQPAVSGKQESVDAAGSAERTTPQSAARGVAGNGLRVDASAPLSSHDETTTTDLVMSTPIIDDSLPTATSGMPHATTGEQVLTAEARQEQVILSSPPASPTTTPGLSAQFSSISLGHASVGVEASAQDASTSSSSYFKAYDSVLSHYPFLSGRSLVSQEPYARASSQGFLPDLKPLKLRVALQQLARERRQDEPVCRYEASGGECRDADCGDRHLSRLAAVEPSDEETARYLGGDARLVDALREARGATYDERVDAAWRVMRR